MWSQTYTQQHLKQIDYALYSIMRARSVQEAVNILIPDDPPRDRFEYVQAAKVFHMRIVMSQPNVMDRDAPPDQAYRVSPIPSSPPLTLIGHWARVAVLSIALEEYENGLGCVLSMQETACQFGDDNILLSAAKMGFGIASLVIPIKAQAEALYRVASMCEVAVLGKKERCSQIHSKDALTLCWLFYTILQDFATMHDPKVPKPGITMLHLKLIPEAEDIDKATRKKFRMREWVNETVRRLGYSTGVK